MIDGSRTVVLTGVTRGLGRALACGLAGLGHTVLGCGRSRQALYDLRTELDGPHSFEVVDVASASEVETWAQQLAARYPAPDLLINNAGLINASAPLWQVPEKEFSQVVDVNIKGTYHTIRSFLPVMLERGRGVVINFSSYWGRSTSPEEAPYCATKWAIEGLTRALAQELPAGLAAVAVNPGTVHTEMLEACFGQSAKSYPGPVKWADRAIPFLLSLGSEHNGKSLTVPGF
ncbi:MAG TPA: SDR family oxidoreductase [Thermoanaerobaculia bacterium]|nr:SDR family oxidoreductase [Thermoanaerobaculia bacterium]